MDVVPMQSQRRRAGVVLVEEGRVALIRREHASGQVYHLFPGGQVEPGETPEEAAVREAREELGLTVVLDGLVAMVEHRQALQYYFRAQSVAGRFGSGDGPEMASPVASPGGRHTPVWIDLQILRSLDVRPAELAAAVADEVLPAGGQPLRISD